MYFILIIYEAHNDHKYFTRFLGTIRLLGKKVINDMRNVIN